MRRKQPRRPSLFELLPPEIVGVCFSFLRSAEQRDLRALCTFTVAAFNAAVRNEHYIAMAGSERNEADFLNPSVRWAPMRTGRATTHPNTGGPKSVVRSVVVSSRYHTVGGRVLVLPRMGCRVRVSLQLVSGAGIKYLRQEDDEPVEKIRLVGFVDLVAIPDNFFSKARVMDHGALPRLEWVGSCWGQGARIFRGSFPALGHVGAAWLRDSSVTEFDLACCPNLRVVGRDGFDGFDVRATSPPLSPAPAARWKP